LIGHEVEKQALGILVIVHFTNRLCKQGVAHVVFNMLVDDEILVRSKLDKAFNLVNKILLLCYNLVLVVCTINGLLALVGFTWLLEIKIFWFVKKML
jgi:hypothetical protein